MKNFLKLSLPSIPATLIAGLIVAALVAAISPGVDTAARDYSGFAPGAGPQGPSGGALAGPLYDAHVTDYHRNR